MTTDKFDDRYHSTEFDKQIIRTIDNPSVLDTKTKLKSLWQLALAERNENKSIQERIATEAARHIGVVEFDNTETDPYQAIVLQFLLMDHMDENYGIEADREWVKLTAMVEKLS